MSDGISLGFMQDSISGILGLQTLDVSWCNNLSALPVRASSPQAFRLRDSRTFLLNPNGIHMMHLDLPLFNVRSSRAYETAVTCM